MTNFFFLAYIENLKWLYFQIVPMTDEKVFNEMNCFKVDGSKEGPIDVQSILPSLEGFELKGNDRVNGQDCQKWQKKEQIEHKMNKYTMWLKVVNGVATPVRYEMKGFNTLLGSHYDHYYLMYKVRFLKCQFWLQLPIILNIFHFQNFNPTKPNPKVFSDYKASSCHGWPGPGIDHTYTMNPMREFINNHHDHIHEAFDDFVDKHDKSYATHEEKNNRKDLFIQNMRFITSKNRKHLTYTLAPNHMADFSEKEMGRYDLSYWSVFSFVVEFLIRHLTK